MSYGGAKVSRFSSQSCELIALIIAALSRVKKGENE